MLGRQPFALTSWVKRKRERVTDEGGGGEGLKVRNIVDHTNNCKATITTV